MLFRVMVMAATVVVLVMMATTVMVDVISVI